MELQLLALCSVFFSLAAAQNVVSIPATGNFRGNDGSWSTFWLQVGTPPQAVEVMASTTSQQIWVVQPAGCDASADVTSCEAARGQVFNITGSTSWEELSGDPNKPVFYDLYYGEYLDYYGNAQYGYDTVTFGLNGSSLPNLSNATVGALATFNFFTGFFGLEPKPTNFTNLNENTQSPMQLLKQQGSIPSLSYGLNPGNSWQNVGQSLTLGGYDAARFDPQNTISYDFTPEPARDLTVQIEHVAWNGTDMITAPFSIGLDSTFAQMYLPIDLCTQFEQAFNLTYNSTYQLYIIDIGQMQSLLSLNPNVTFTLGGGTSAQSINITLPYSSFNLQALSSFNNLTADVYYFPINRANDSSQYSLGRAFLQDAYLSVDFERSKFNISAMDWSDTTTNDFVVIPPVTPDGSSGLSGGAIAGIVVGVIAGLAIVGVALFFFLRRKRAARRDAEEAEAEKKRKEKEPSDSQSEYNTYFKPELEAPIAPHAGGKGKNPASELESPLSTQRSPTTAEPVEVGGSRQVFEMEGDLPKPTELEQGRNLSEKEQMIFRERMHNGIDPAESGSPLSQHDEAQ